MGDGDPVYSRENLFEMYGDSPEKMLKILAVVIMYTHVKNLFEMYGDSRENFFEIYEWVVSLMYVLMDESCTPIKLQVSFLKRATMHRALLRETTNKDTCDQ